jgi:hypothetical protein
VFPVLDRRRIAVLIALAAVAAVLAASYAFVRPVSVTARSTVWVSRVLPVGSSGDILQSIAQFESAALLPATKDAIASRASISPTSVSGLEFKIRSGSSAVEVSYSSPHAGEADRVVDVAAPVILRSLAAQAVDGAQSQVSAADRALSSSLDALAAFNAKHGVADVNQAYNDREQDLTNLQGQLSEVPADESPALVAAIATCTREISLLRAALPQWQVLDGDVTQVVGALSSATSNLTTARTQQLAADSPTVITPIETSRTSRATEVATLIIVAFLLALSLGLLILTATDLYERYRKTHEEPGGSSSMPVSPTTSLVTSGGPVPPRQSGQGRDRGGPPPRVRPTGSPVDKPW